MAGDRVGRPSDRWEVDGLRTDSGPGGRDGPERDGRCGRGRGGCRVAATPEDPMTDCRADGLPAPIATEDDRYRTPTGHRSGGHPPAAHPWAGPLSGALPSAGRSE